ncbi:MAG: RNA helicase [Candidatus Dadabacteria bacterium]
MNFEEFSLSDGVSRAIRDMGFDIPTPIQERAIPYALIGRDIIGQAQTGTGKTIAFGIPLVEKIEPLEKGVQAIALTPTRELAVQVAKEIEKVGKYKQISVLPVYGGEPIERQLKHLKKGVHVVVGTPGRVIDHIRRGTLSLKSIHFAVLDEADRMLDMGFIDGMKFILARIPGRCQKMMFSATIPSQIAWLAKRYMKDPVEIMVSKDVLTVPQIKQMFFEITEFDKLNALTRLIDLEKKGVFLVFRKTKTGVDDLAAALKARGYNVRAIHGNRSQSERDRVMRLFRIGKIDILVATDVAARGLDIDGITHVVNYDIPQDAESYIHRIGRTGRAGKGGVAITFLTPWEYGELKRIQSLSGTKIEKASIPIDIRYTRAHKIAGV